MARHFYRIFEREIPHVYNRLFRPVPYVHNVRLYVAGPSRKSESDAPVYIKTDHEYRLTKKATVKALEEILNMKTIDAIHIVSNNRAFRKVSRATLKSNLTLYLEKGVTFKTVNKYPEILTVLDSVYKLDQLRKLPHKTDAVVVLVLLNFGDLVKLVKSELSVDKKQNKIVVLSSLLKITEQKACEYLVQKPFLISLSTNKIETNIKLLTEYEVSTEDICNDLWVLRYSEELIRNRLSTAKQCNLDTMKTWMVRAPEDAFQTYIQRRSDNKSILGDNSLAEYLSKRLECSIALADYIMVKQPAVQNKSMKKLKELIDFLYSQGFKSRHICRVPKILVHSVETTRKRLKQLEDKGIQIDSLSMLTKSQNQFMQNYDALLKSKNKAKSTS